VYIQETFNLYFY